MTRIAKRTSSETISEEARLREIDERHFLAQQIFFRRESRAWSQEELARASGLTQAQVATLEAGQANPTLRTLAKLATALSCGVHDLFQDSDQHPGLLTTEVQASATTALRAPLDVEGIDAGVTTDEIVSFVREGRERS
jgi:transcriptional regulator with XRE-family HTH domain